MEALLTTTGLRVTAETEFPPHITIERQDGGLVQVLPGELRSLVTALCAAAGIVAESVTMASGATGSDEPGEFGGL